MLGDFAAGFRRTVGWSCAAVLVSFLVPMCVLMCRGERRDDLMIDGHTRELACTVRGREVVLAPLHGAEWSVRLFDAGVFDAGLSRGRRAELVTARGSAVLDAATCDKLEIHTALVGAKTDATLVAVCATPVGTLDAQVRLDGKCTK